VNAKMMQTECPHCHTVFEISEELLYQAEGQVRCGHCLAIFTADNPYTSPNTEQIDTDIHDDLIEKQLDNNHDDEDKTIDPTLEEESGKFSLPDVIPANLRAETRDPNKHYSIIGTLFWSSAILAMILTGLLQYAYYDRLHLVKFNELRPWLGLLCEYAQCDLPEPRDPKRIELSSKNIFTHPNSENALMISATIVNQAAFEQDFPLLELRFENIRGQMITGRHFKPYEYLAIPEDQISKMEPGSPVSFNIEIIDPGKEMVSYAFEFL
jgi:predicted Zn finger-like uncharacterized protein